MHEVLVNRLGGLSLPRKSVVRLTDRPDMTLDVYRGRKTTNQTIKMHPGHGIQCSRVRYCGRMDGYMTTVRNKKRPTIPPELPVTS